MTTPDNNIPTRFKLINPERRDYAISCTFEEARIEFGGIGRKPQFKRQVTGAAIIDLATGRTVGEFSYGDADITLSRDCHTITIDTGGRILPSVLLTSGEAPRFAFGDDLEWEAI